MFEGNLWRVVERSFAEKIREKLVWMFLVFDTASTSQSCSQTELGSDWPRSSIARDGGLRPNQLTLNLLTQVTARGTDSHLGVAHFRLRMSSNPQPAIKSTTQVINTHEIVNQNVGRSNQLNFTT